MQFPLLLSTEKWKDSPGSKRGRGRARPRRDLTDVLKEAGRDGWYRSINLWLTLEYTNLDNFKGK